MFRKKGMYLSITIIMATLLVASTGLSQQQEAPPAKSLMDITPAKPLLFVEMSGLSSPMFDKESNVWQQISQAPFWEMLYAELEVQSKVRDIHLAIEPGLHVLSHLFGQDVVLILPEFKQITEISPVFMFQLKGDDDLGDILANSIKIAMANAGKKFSEYGGYTIANMPLPEGVPFGLSLALLDDIFAVGLGEGTIKKVIDLKNGSDDVTALTQDEDFMSIMERLPVTEKIGQYCSVFHINLAKIVEFGNLIFMLAGDRIPDERLRGVAGMALKWMDIVPSVSTVSAMTDEGVVSQGYTPLNPNATAKNLLAMLQREPEQLGTMKFAPADAMGYSGNNIIDLPLLWQMINDLFAEIPEAREEILDKLEEMQEMFGFNLEEDVFSWMGNEFAFIYADYPAPSEQNIPQRICLILSVKDAEKASQSLQKLIELGMSLMEDANADLNIQPQEYEGETIYALTELPLPINPGYAIVDNYLLLSASTEYIKHLIDCAAGRTPGLASNPQFQSVQNRIPEKVNSIEFLDMRRYMDSMITNTIQQMHSGREMPTWDDADLDLDAVMMLQLRDLANALTPMFGASISIAVNDGKGLHSNSLIMIKDLETVVPINDPPAAKIARSLNIAQDYHEAEMLDRAMKHYTRVLEFDADNWNALIGAARTLQQQGKGDKAEEYWSRLGFPSEGDWYILGPFDNAGGMELDTPHQPEENVDIEAEYEGLEGVIKWEKWADETRDGFVDFQYMFEPDEWVIAYAWMTVTSATTQDAQLRVGSDDDVKVWINGEEVLRREEGRAAQPDQDIVSVTLNEGENQVLVKVCNREMAWGFYLRFTDDNGKPLQDLEYGR